MLARHVSNSIKKSVRFKGFQREDYARAALHDGVILGHDTGGGKGLALFVWPCLKTGFFSGVKALKPKGAVLLVAPGDLHEQVMDEGREKFHATTTVIDSQEKFLRLSTVNGTTGVRQLPPGFYITSYTQLGTNGVAEFPGLRDCLAAGSINGLFAEDSDVEAYHGQRGILCQLHYERLRVLPEATPAGLKSALKAAIAANWELRAEYTEAYEQCRHFAGPFNQLTDESFLWLHGQMLRARYVECRQNIGHTEYINHRKIKCVYSATLADLSSDTFDCVAVDEGVKMKGETTHIGLGVRQMTPKYRLVLTATPIKNRLPDIFWLAWWAAGGHSEASPRWPFADDPADSEAFAEEFLISERNITAQEEGKSRYKKRTPQVCNVHKLWKLFAPIVLRRRKKDFGEDVVPKHRNIVRMPLGLHQAMVYQHHLLAKYKDGKGRPAIGPQLQALRIAAANPSSALLKHVPGPANKHLPHVSNHDYTPKVHAALKLIHQIMARGEQVVIFSAFQDSLDTLSARLNQSGIKHLVADGRMSQTKRGQAIKQFKLGGPRAYTEGHTHRTSEYPVLLAGIESVAEGHSMNLCNNVILMCYSWAYDKFEQAINRAHRLNSPWPVNVYPIICDNSIDRKLEALIQEKGDAAELVLDGHLLGELSSEVNLAELLDIARREFNTKNTVDEAVLARQWPDLRTGLAATMVQWTRQNYTVPESMEVESKQDTRTETIVQATEMDNLPLWRRRLYAIAVGN
jgi:hypothetical protein